MFIAAEDVHCMFVDVLWGMCMLPNVAWIYVSIHMHKAV